MGSISKSSLSGRFFPENSLGDKRVWDDEFGDFCKHGTEDIIKDRIVRICQKDGSFYG